MVRGLTSLWNSLVDYVRLVLITAPWRLSTFIFRLLYGFHVEGEENIPSEGPFIVALNEYSPVAMLVSGWISIVVLLANMPNHKPGSTMSYMQEELFAFRYFRQVLGATHAERTEGGFAALTPHGAGRLSLGLLDGYRALQDGGLVVINPEGDAPWDGRSLPLGKAIAWLGLHTAAPILPALCSVGAYDIWPRWRTTPSLRGKLSLSIGRPLKLCDAPLSKVSDDDLAQANARIQEEFDLIRYGPGGISEWAGPPLRDGAPVEQPIRLQPPAEPLGACPAEDARVPVWKRGIPLLLWRCPVCHTNDALLHQRPLFRRETVGCQVCGTRWEVRHVPGRDFRLKVVEGAPDLVGLDMALSAWYDEMKRDFRPAPIPANGVDLLPAEEVYLEVSGVSLSPYRPNALFYGWNGREPPQALLPGRRELADWGSIGKGRLLLTSRRLLWQSEQGELDFKWSLARDVSLWLLNTLAIMYGAAPYRFSLGQEVGLKWLTYAGTLALQAAEREGHNVTTSVF